MFILAAGVLLEIFCFLLLLLGRYNLLDKMMKIIIILLSIDHSHPKSLDLYGVIIWVNKFAALVEY